MSGMLGAMDSSSLELHPGDISGSVALVQPGSVLMSMALVTNGGRVDALSVGPT